MCRFPSAPWEVVGFGGPRLRAIVSAGLAAASLWGCLITDAAAQVPRPDPAPGTSGSQPAVGDLTLEDLLRMEVQSVFGASKFLQKITEAPANVTVVTAEEIERYGWRTLADVLRSVRGFYVTDDRSWAYVGVRGFQRPGDYNTRVLLVVDGERMNDNVYDQALLQEDSPIDMADVAQIEIVRGPSSSLYGSSAFFGLINVVTKGAAHGASVMTEMGTLGLRTARMRLGREFQNGAVLGLTASAQAMDGITAAYFPEFDRPETNNGVANDLDYTRRRNVLGRFGIGGFDVNVGYNRRVHGYATGAYDTVFNDPRAAMTDETVFATGAWQGAVGGGWTGAARLGVHSYRYIGHYPYGTDGPEPLDNIDIGRGRWLSNEARMSRALTARHRLTIGLEHRQDLDMTMLNYFDPSAPIVDIRARSMRLGSYVQDEWRLHPRLLVSAGIRWDRYARFADPVKPRLAAIFQPDHLTTMKLLYGEAYRAPNAYESDFQYPGGYKANPALKAEEVKTLEGFVERYVSSRVHLSASVFRSSVSRLIDLRTAPEDGVAYYDNLTSARSSGIEGEVEAKWPHGVQARVSYTYAHVRGTDGSQLTNAPAHLAQALFSAPLVGHTVVGIDVRALSARLTDADGEVSAHVVPNLTVSGPVGDGRLRFAVTVSNLTNARYADPVAADFSQLAVPQYGRTARLRMFVAF